MSKSCVKVWWISSLRATKKNPDCGSCMHLGTDGSERLSSYCHFAGDQGGGLRAVGCNKKLAVLKYGVIYGLGVSLLALGTHCSNYVLAWGLFINRSCETA